MKKHFLLLAGSALILASCGSNENKTQNQQNTMDSIAKANQALQDEVNKKKNDSTIAAMAKSQADSIEKERMAHEGNAKSGAKTTHTKTTTTKETTTTTPPPAPAPTVGNGKPSMKDQPAQNGQKSGNTVGNGKPTMK